MTFSLVVGSKVDEYKVFNHVSVVTSIPISRMSFNIKNIKIVTLTLLITNIFE